MVFVGEYFTCTGKVCVFCGLGSMSDTVNHVRQLDGVIQVLCALADVLCACVSPWGGALRGPTCPTTVVGFSGSVGSLAGYPDRG